MIIIMILLQLFIFFSSLQFYDGVSLTTEVTSRSSSSAHTHIAGHCWRRPFSFPSRSHLFLPFSSSLSSLPLPPSPLLIVFPSSLLDRILSYILDSPSISRPGCGQSVLSPFPPFLLLELRPGILLSIPYYSFRHSPEERLPIDEDTGRQFSPQSVAKAERTIIIFTTIFCSNS